MEQKEYPQGVLTGNRGRRSRAGGLLGTRGQFGDSASQVRSQSGPLCACAGRTLWRVGDLTAQIGVNCNGIGLEGTTLDLQRGKG